MRQIIFLLFLTLSLNCCTTSHKANSFQANDKPGNNLPTPGTRDGSSFDKAIIIMETSETEGIDAEYAWLKAHYPYYKMKQQSLASHDKKNYDILSVTTAVGKDIDVYFDISNFFGKF